MIIDGQWCSFLLFFRTCTHYILLVLPLFSGDAIVVNQSHQLTEISPVVVQAGAHFSSTGTANDNAALVEMVICALRMNTEPKEKDPTKL